MQESQFALKGPYIELFKLLKTLGISESGGSGKALVSTGAVRVDGQVELRKGCKIRAGQVVEVGDFRVKVCPGD
jgi:ribosome-associated protein